MKPLEGARVGIVEDDPVMGESLAQSLSLEGMTVDWWKSGEAALVGLQNASPDVLICDIRLPGVSGEELLRRLAEGAWRGPLLFMTAYSDIDQAVRLMRHGAGDYVTKPFEMADFLTRLGRLIPEATGPSALGVSVQMRAIERLLSRIAESDGPVFFTGPTGVGKDVCARRLHELSRPGTPFVSVNCAAIPADLLEAEIFGSESGMGPGHQPKQHRGYAERAAAGILFLDEICNTSLAVQAKLLHLIEAKTFVRLGGEEPVPFRARVLAATNASVEENMAHGVFRSDLYYRLNTFVVDVPPLSERPDDVAWLLERYVAAFIEASGRPLNGLSALAIDAARAHRWPGNVRELRNRVERGVALAEGPWLLPHDLFPHDRRAALDVPKPLADVRDAAERRAIQGALAETGRVVDAARLLGVSRTTLWEKMKRLGVE